MSVKSSRLRVRDPEEGEVEEEGDSEEVVPLETVLMTRQVWVTPPGSVAVMVALPRPTAVTSPVSSTVTTLVSEEDQVMVPVEPAGISVALIWTGSG